MAVITVKLNTAKFHEKMQEKILKVREKLEAEWNDIAVLCLLDIAKRAPTHEVEYDWIMRGGNSLVIVPLVGNQSGDSDKRTRFIREPGMWLNELVLDERTYSINPSTLTMEFGYIPALQQLSNYSWKNKDGTVQISKNGVWYHFEYGSLIGPSSPVKPRTQGKKGRGYYLSPNETTRLAAMSKVYPRFGMYTKFHRSVFRNAVVSRIKQIKF